MNEEIDFSNCKLCQNIPKYKAVEKLHIDERLPKEMRELKVIGGYSLDDQIRKCDLCGTY